MPVTAGWTSRRQWKSAVQIAVLRAVHLAATRRVGKFMICGGQLGTGCYGHRAGLNLKCAAARESKGLCPADQVQIISSFPCPSDSEDYYWKLANLPLRLAISNQLSLSHRGWPRARDSDSDRTEPECSGESESATECIVDKNPATKRAKKSLERRWLMSVNRDQTRR